MSKVKSESTKCEHKNKTYLSLKDYINKGFPCICKDCGKLTHY